MSNALTRKIGMKLCESYAETESLPENETPVGLGTDTACPFSTHYDIWRELQYFHKYVNVSRKFALYTAAKRNAEIAGIEKETGSIEIRKNTDFLITEKNPLEDLQALRTPFMVVMRGKIYEKPAVKNIPYARKNQTPYYQTAKRPPASYL